MSGMIRREAISRLAGGGACAMLGLAGSVPAATSEPGREAVVVQATLTPAHAQGRKLCGFLETGVEGGYVLCTLTRQDERNPAVQSVFASPARRGSRLGVEISISFFTEPRGEITFSLLHVPMEVGRPASRVVPLV